MHASSSSNKAKKFALVVIVASLVTPFSAFAGHCQDTKDKLYAAEKSHQTAEGEYSALLAKGSASKKSKNEGGTDSGGLDAALAKARGTWKAWGDAYKEVDGACGVFSKAKDDISKHKPASNIFGK